VFGYQFANKAGLHLRYRERGKGERRKKRGDKGRTDDILPRPPSTISHPSSLSFSRKGKKVKGGEEGRKGRRGIASASRNPGRLSAASVETVVFVEREKKKGRERGGEGKRKGKGGEEEIRRRRVNAFRLNRCLLFPSPVRKKRKENGRKGGGGEERGRGGIGSQEIFRC